MSLSTSAPSRADTAALEYELRRPGRRHPDTNVFRRSEQRLRKAGSVTPTAYVKCVGTSAWRCHNCSCRTRSVEKLEPYRTRNYSNEGPRGTSLWSTVSIPLLAEAHVCFQKKVVYKSNFANDYYSHTLSMRYFCLNCCGRTNMFYTRKYSQHPQESPLCAG
jgi:hypothetical protein